MYEFSCNILQKNPKELCGQPNNFCPSLEPFSFILWFPATSTPHTGCCSPGAFKLHWPEKTQVSLPNTMTKWVCPRAFCHPNIQHTHSWNKKLMKQCFILKTGKFHSPLKDCHAYFEKRQYENEAKTWVHIEMGLNPKVATYFVQVTLETSVFPNCKMRAMATS